MTHKATESTIRIRLKRSSMRKLQPVVSKVGQDCMFEEKDSNCTLQIISIEVKGNLRRGRLRRWERRGSESKKSERILTISLGIKIRSSKHQIESRRILVVQIDLIGRVEPVERL